MLPFSIHELSVCLNIRRFLCLTCSSSVSTSFCVHFGWSFSSVSGGVPESVPGSDCGSAYCYGQQFFQTMLPVLDLQSFSPHVYYRLYVPHVRHLAPDQVLADILVHIQSDLHLPAFSSASRTSTRFAGFRYWISARCISFS